MLRSKDQQAVEKARKITSDYTKPHEKAMLKRYAERFDCMRNRI
jgi:hypothetical protein